MLDLPTSEHGSTSHDTVPKHTSCHIMRLFTFSPQFKRLATQYWPVAIATACTLLILGKLVANHTATPEQPWQRALHTTRVKAGQQLLGLPRPDIPIGNCFGCPAKRPLKIRHRSYNPGKFTVYYGVRCIHRMCYTDLMSTRAHARARARTHAQKWVRLRCCDTACGKGTVIA